eukprot:15644026-Heterocapsa_arctica.AAC.1
MDYMKEDQRDIYYIVGKNTDGPGMVVGEHLAETIKSHTDLLKDNDNAKHLKKALKFYTSLVQRAVECGFAVDIFACSLDQVGLYEMKVVTDKTGGKDNYKKFDEQLR